MALCSTPVLQLLDFTQKFVIETDASGAGMGAVLLQEEKPIAFFSNKFPSHLTKASAYIRELHALVEAVRKWRQYLLGAHFTIRTDHRSLKELLTQVIQTPDQQKYLVKLLGYDYSIVYKSGQENRVANALSWQHEGHLLAISIPQINMVTQLQTEYTTLPEF